MCKSNLEGIMNFNINFNVHECNPVKYEVKMLAPQSCLTLATAWIVSSQAPLSMQFYRQEYQSGAAITFSRRYPNPGSNPGLLHCSQIVYHLSHQGSPVKL